MELAEKLVYLRKQKGWTQTQLTETLNISRQAISRWEVGAAVPSIDNLKVLSELYNVGLDSLLNEEEEKIDSIPAEQLIPQKVEDSKKSAKWKWGVLLSLVGIIAICIGVGVYCKMGQEERGLTYEFRKIDILYLYAIRPILWICVGMLAGALTGLGKKMPVILRRTLAIAAGIAVLAVACAMIVHVYGDSVKWTYKIAYLCIMRPKLLTIPGFVCGISMKL